GMRRGGRGEAFVLPLGKNEVVDGRARPVLLLHAGKRGLSRRPEAPKGSRLVQVERAPGGEGRRRGCSGGAGARPSHFHPGCKSRDLLVTQLTLRRHLETEVLGGNGFDQQAVLG